MQTKTEVKPIEVGIFAPGMKPTEGLFSGEVGYIATGFKTVSDCHVGDTVTLATSPADEPLPGYRKVKPMVYAGILPGGRGRLPRSEGCPGEAATERCLAGIRTGDIPALNFGFRCGFLGLFHMEIIQERLEREFDLDIVVTAPSVEYEVTLIGGEIVLIDSPAKLPEENAIEVHRRTVDGHPDHHPTEYYGTIMDLVTKRRGIFDSQDYPAPNRVQLSFQIPLTELIIDFFDNLKSRTRGYASLDYHFLEYRTEKLVKLEILVDDAPLDALASIVHKDDAYHKGQRLVTKLKDIIPRQQFDVAVQAYASGRVISSAKVKQVRKDVLAKCYGGDISRKKKLLEKQKKGKKRMKKVGNVEIPQEAFMAVLRLDED